uniref:ABM domain-containing protein n=1 Tax=Haptolina ericina TaxID=156174 RepID=A0A7S3FGB4_9EUKA
MTRRLCSLMFLNALTRVAPRVSRIAVAQRARGLCIADGVQVDMVSRVFSCKVKDDASAYQLDLVFDNMLDKAAEVEGCAGAARLVCKTEWDYKLIIKFEDVDSLKGYMTDHHDGVMAEFLPQIKELAVGGEVHQQNFVYDDIE